MDQGKQILQELGLILQAADEMNCNRVLCFILDQKRNRNVSWYHTLTVTSILIILKVIYNQQCII